MPDEPTAERRLAWPKDMRTDRYNWELARGQIHAFGEARPLASWAEDPRCQVSREALRTRLALGWHPEDAISRTRHDKPVLQHTYAGRTLTLRGWADQSGIKYHTLSDRITKYGMTFEEALEKGPDGRDFTVPITAFGETKPISHWAVDPRAACAVTTLQRRLKNGWDPEDAITTEPDNRSKLGTGTPYSAFGMRMGLEDWGRHTQIPTANIRDRLNRDGLPLEDVLHSLGWTPAAGTGTTRTRQGAADLVRVAPEDLRPGDRILSTDTEGQQSSLTVRRPSATTAPPAPPTPPSPRPRTR